MQFVLLFIGIILIAINIRAIKEDKSPKSEGFNQNLNVAHDNMDKNEAEIMKMRKEMGETFYSLQEEIQDLKEEIKKVVQNIDTLDEEEAILPNSQCNDKKVDEHKEKVKVSNSNNIKIEEIKKLIDEGKNIDEICEILNMGKGEILLIKDLYLD